MSLEDDVKSALQSKTVIAGIVSFIATVLSVVFKYEFPVGFETEIATQFVAGVAALFTIYGRIKAVKKIG